MGRRGGGLTRSKKPSARVHGPEWLHALASCKYRGEARLKLKTRSSQSSSGSSPTLPLFFRYPNSPFRPSHPCYPCCYHAAPRRSRTGRPEPSSAPTRPPPPPVTPPSAPLPPRPSSSTRRHTAGRRPRTLSFPGFGFEVRPTRNRRSPSPASGSAAGAVDLLGWLGFMRRS
jgi:hypothetical protein